MTNRIRCVIRGARASFGNRDEWLCTSQLCTTEATSHLIPTFSQILRAWCCPVAATAHQSSALNTRNLKYHDLKSFITRQWWSCGLYKNWKVVNLGRTLESEPKSLARTEKGDWMSKHRKSHFFSDFVDQRYMIHPIQLFRHPDFAPYSYKVVNTLLGQKCLCHLIMELSQDQHMETRGQVHLKRELK